MVHGSLTQRTEPDSRLPLAPSSGTLRPMRVTRLPVPQTERLAREAARWQVSGRNLPAPVAPGPGQVSVWSFPRPPAVERVHERVAVEWAGVCVAETSRALRVCETAAPPTYYLPRSAFVAGCLVDAPGGSYCEWKGQARYHCLKVGEQSARHAAWSYPALYPEYAVLAEHVGVYAGRVERCTIGGVPVQPQPGSFYAGWVTPELTGPFKGEAGSEGW